MAMAKRSAAPHQRLVVTASNVGAAPLEIEAVGAPVEFLIASRESLQDGSAIDSSWGTTGIYVLIGGPEVSLGPGDPVTAYDELLGRSASEEPPDDPFVTESFEQSQHTEHWRARFYTGLTRDLIRRMGEHLAKPWWNRALLCRQSPPMAYDGVDIGFLEGELHLLLDAAYWLKREGRASNEPAIHEDREINLREGHLPAISAAIRLLGVPLDTKEQVDAMLASKKVGRKKKDA